MLTKRRTPFSSSSRSRMPGCFFSRLSMSSPTLRPSAETSSLPPVSVRSGVGIRTMVDIFEFLLQSRGRWAAGVPFLHEIDDDGRAAAEHAVVATRHGQDAELIGETV